jgi:iron complex transport system substrate-binding protein
VTAEQVVRADPSLIVIDPEGTTVAKEEALAGFSAIRAVKHHRVYALPQPSYVDQPSPGLVLGLKEFAEIFHPGLKITVPST